MIWHAGKIIADDALSIPVTDRSFEHGLGLFETLRTWEGRAFLLPRHLDRLIDSACALGLSLDLDSLPVELDVQRLIAANHHFGDAMVRLTATGGSDSRPSVVWMRTLPSPEVNYRARLLVGPWSVSYDDPMARHKSLNYWSRRMAHQAASSQGFDEVVSLCDGRAWEGSRTNLFVVDRGRVMTPTTQGPIVPGVMRQMVIEVARRAEIPVEEVAGIENLEAAEEVFLTNAIRGIVAVRSAGATTWSAPGPLTERLQGLLSEAIWEGIKN